MTFVSVGLVAAIVWLAVVQPARRQGREPQSRGRGLERITGSPPSRAPDRSAPPESGRPISGTPAAVARRSTSPVAGSVGGVDRREASEDWPRSLVAGLIGREPIPSEESAVRRAARALPSEIAGRLPIAFVLASASRSESTPRVGGAVRVEHIFESLVGRRPTTRESAVFLECLEEGTEREASMALASSRRDRATGGSPPRSRAPGVVIACAEVLGISELFAGSGRFPTLRRMARDGVLALDLSATGETPQAAITALLGNVNDGGGGGAPAGILARMREASAGESWVVVPRAAGWDSFAPAAIDDGDGTLATRLWCADGASHPAVRELLSAFGRPAPLDSDGWERVQSLRSALEVPVSEFELQQTIGLAADTAGARGIPIEFIVEALLRERLPRLVVAVVGPQARDGSLMAGTAAALEALTRELYPILSRRKGWLVVVSPGGRSSRGGTSGSGFVLAAGRPFRAGRVLSGPHSLAAVRGSLSRALGLQGPIAEERISAMFRR